MGQSKSEITKPIFIIGCYRSGTSIFYNKLAQNPDVATITQTTKKMPGSLLLTRFLMCVRSDFKNNFPTEANNIWGKFGKKNDDSLVEDDLTPHARRFFIKVVKNQLKLFHKSRFVSKCPRNSFRIEYLNKIFPDAIFIHMIRDGRAVANSILRNREKKKFSFDGPKFPGWEELLDLPMVESSGMEWKKTIEYIQKSAKILPEERYIEARYEDFMDNPVEVLISIEEKCGLKWGTDHIKLLTKDLENRNYKWRHNFSSEEIVSLNTLLGDLLKSLKYEI